MVEEEKEIQEIVWQRIIQALASGGQNADWTVVGVGENGQCYGRVLTAVCNVSGCGTRNWSLC